jgi:hypothetical protein
LMEPGGTSVASGRRAAASLRAPWKGGTGSASATASATGMRHRTTCAWRRRCGDKALRIRETHGIYPVMPFPGIRSFAPCRRLHRSLENVRQRAAHGEPCSVRCVRTVTGIGERGTEPSARSSTRVAPQGPLNGLAQESTRSRAARKPVKRMGTLPPCQCQHDIGDLARDERAEILRLWSEERTCRGCSAPAGKGRYGVCYAALPRLAAYPRGVKWGAAPRPDRSVPVLRRTQSPSPMDDRECGGAHHPAPARPASDERTGAAWPES